MSNAPIKSQIIGALRGYAGGATASVVARELDLSPETVVKILDGLYVSSRVECCLLGEGVYLYRLAPLN